MKRFIALLLIAGSPVLLPAQQVFVVDPMMSFPPATPPVAGAARMQLVAPRGGFASGQVVVVGTTPFTSLPVSAGPLVGPSSLPVRVRYPSRKKDLSGKLPDTTERFDALSDKLVPGESVQPVWVTVEVPATAAAGTYRGELAVAGKRVPIDLLVTPFTMPALGSRELVVDTLVSPDTVAQWYGVVPYSEAHFKLMEPSLALQGRIGNNVLNVPVIGETYLGAETGLIHFQSAGGKLTPNFQAFDKYFAAYTRWNGPPKAVVVWIFDAYLSGKKDPAQVRDDFTVTTIGPDGKLGQAKVESYAAQPEMIKSLMQGMVQRVGNVPVFIGQASDAKPRQETADLLASILPGFLWAAWTHGYGYKGWFMETGAEVGLYSTPDFTPESKGVRGGWSEPKLRLNSLRSWLNMTNLPWRWRVAPDLSCGRHKQGIARGYSHIGVDYWNLPAKEGKKGTRTLWAGPYPGLKYSRLDRGQPPSMTVPGPAGAMSTIRLEMLAEGAQEAEARIAVERGIKAGRITKDTAEPILAARYQNLKLGAKLPPPTTAEETVFDTEWTAKVARLYELAAQAQRPK